MSVCSVSSHKKIFRLAAFLCLTIVMGAPAVAQRVVSEFPSDTTVDERIRQRVEVKLAGKTQLNLEDFSFDVTKGIVRLRGSVASIGQKHMVGRIADSAVGVVGVINDLTVRVSSRPDEGIRQEIVHLLERRPRFFNNPITVVVGSGGQVSLTGTVQRGIDRLEAVRIASEVVGVTQVSANLILQDAEGLSPELIRSRVYSTLSNPLTFGVIRNLQVTIDDDRIVTLRGDAVSDSQRALAARKALIVPGVTDILNEIRVLGS